MGDDSEFEIRTLEITRKRAIIIMNWLNIHANEHLVMTTRESIFGVQTQRMVNLHFLGCVIQQTLVEQYCIYYTVQFIFSIENGCL